MLLQLWLLPFKLISLWSEIVTRKIGRHFKGSDLPIKPSGTWKKAPNLPSFRYEFGAATVDDNIYVVGGVIAPTVYFPTNLVEVFGVKKNNWCRVKNHPVIIHHPGVTSDGNQVYVIGGNGIRIISYRCAHAYDPIRKSWMRLPDMPTKRCALGLAYWAGKIYAVGGADNKYPLSKLEEYDIKTQTWKRLPDMSTAREHLFAVAASNKIYAIGGYQHDRFHNVNTFEVYDIETKKWSKLAPLPAKVSGITAAVWGKSIYVFGGEQGWAVSAEVYEYQIDKNIWKRIENLKTARYAAACAVASDGIHIIGGNTRMYTDKFSYDHDIYQP